MFRSKNFKLTVFACYIAYITQAIVNNFAPLLFLTFNRNYNIPLAQIGLLVTVNFVTQIIVDFVSAKLVDKIGYRISIVAGHIFSVLGFVGMAILPEILPPFLGIAICIVLYAIGGGVAEVLVSPILEACPGDEKEAAMSLLHSFYCWGSVLVILVSTLLFKFIGIEYWKFISCGRALIPLFNSFFFCFVPINILVSKEEKMPIRQLLVSSIFWKLVILMICAGASELAISQWASAFVESGLNLSKMIGDLVGPCLFAVLMGISRVFHSKIGSKVEIDKYLKVSALLCILGYLMIVFSPFPFISLIGCGICGLAVAAMWPGTFSLATKTCPHGGTALFAFLALAGDVGCSAGPTIAGFVSSACNDVLKWGLLTAIAFPLIMFTVLSFTFTKGNVK